MFNFNLSNGIQRSEVVLFIAEVALKRLRAVDQFAGVQVNHGWNCLEKYLHIQYMQYTTLLPLKSWPAGVFLVATGGNLQRQRGRLARFLSAAAVFYSLLEMEVDTHTIMIGGADTVLMKYNLMLFSMAPYFFWSHSRKHSTCVVGIELGRTISTCSTSIFEFRADLEV